MLKEFDTRSAIAIALVCSMIAITFVLIFHPAPDSDILKVLIGGFMTVGFASIINFYFGSSTGSKAKDDTLNQIAVATAIPPAPIVPPAAPPAPPAA